MNPLNPQLPPLRDALAARFAAAQPFRHVVIDDFLEPALARAMADQFPSFDTRYALNEMGQVGGKAVRTAVRDLSDAYRRIDEGIQDPAFLGFVSAITGIPELRYDPDYVGGGTHENRDGQGLDPHIDFNYHPRTRWHRRLNLIVYLNDDWDPAWGGSLELHSDPWNPDADRRTVVPPRFNRCVIFETSERSWHGFPEIRLPPEKSGSSRRSFAIYLYTESRPAEETAPPHATVYVPATALPDGVAAGRVLSAESMRETERRFARMRGQLQFLYRRELEFGDQIARLERAIEGYREAQRIDLQGYALQHGARGVWPDGWIARGFELRFTPTRRSRALELDLWVPDALADGQVLTVCCNGETRREQVGAGSRRRLRIELDARPGDALTLSIAASAQWVPAAAGASGDERPLAWRLLSAELEHR